MTPRVVRADAKKQTISHEDFLAIKQAATGLVPAAAYRLLLDGTLREIASMTRGRRVGYAWSGGKDSQALEVVMQLAGVEDCCFGMTNLEYVAFLTWVTNHMPAGLQVYNNGWDLDWLRNHEAWIFPQTAAAASRWFNGVQRKAQAQFSAANGIELLIHGGRACDGNYVGDGAGVFMGAEGVLRYAPLRHWSHADVFACLHYAGVEEEPPFYRWPRGYRCGTHPWPARQWCRTRDDGYAEVYAIEPALIREAAAAGIASARTFLARTGRL